MKRQLSLFGIMMMGILTMTGTSVLAADAIMYETKFDPYFIGRQQRDNLIVVNHSGREQPYSLQVGATAYDPFTGEQLDVQRADIAQGAGARVSLTETYPAPHASQLVVKVDVVGDGLGADVISEHPFSITRVLTTSRDATVLQVIGDPTLLTSD